MTEHAALEETTFETMTQAVAKARGNAQVLVESLALENGCLKTWDFDSLEAALRDRSPLLVAMQASWSHLSKLAAVESSPATPDAVRTQVDALVATNLAGAKALKAEWSAFLETLSQLDQLHRVNAAMIQLGRRVFDNTIRQLVDPATAQNEPGLYDARGSQRPDTGSRTLGLA